MTAGAALGVARLVLVEPATDERRVPDRPVQVPGEGFVSSQTCRACHPSQYQSWHRSYHRTMTQVAAPETAAADFEDVTVDASAGGPMALEQRGRELWAEFADPDAAPASATRRIKRRVVMMTGSRGSSNAKARRELAWEPAHPSWRSGFAATAAGAPRVRARTHER